MTDEEIESDLPEMASTYSQMERLLQIREQENDLDIERRANVARARLELLIDWQD